MGKTIKIRKRNRKVGQLKGRLLFCWSLALRIAGRAWPVVVIFALIFAGRAYQTTSCRFALGKLLVNQSDHVDAKQVLDFIDARIGTNLFTIDLRQLHARLMDHPWIKDVVVTRKLPDTLIVTIEEHHPFALINLGSLYYVDQDGFLFKRLEKGDSKDYPILSGFSTQDFLNSAPAARTNVNRLKTAVNLVELAQQKGGMPLNQISEVRFDPFGGYSLILEPKGTQLRLGENDFEGKLHRFNLIKKRLGQQTTFSLVSVDLVNPKQAVIKGLRRAEKG